ncbi:MAG TPA: chromosome segregation protein SMC, partial [Gammaproteobacteria bacterium]
QREHDALRERIEALRGEGTALRESLDQLRDRQQRGRGRQASLEALQQAALGKTDGAVGAWLERGGLADAPRLAERLQPLPGWETALETVLGPSLEAVIVDELDSHSARAAGLESGHLFLYAAGSQAGTLPATGEPLSRKLNGGDALGSLLAGVYAADDLDGALALRGRLAAHESVVTRDGLWFGPDWLRVARERDERTGVLARGQELRELEQSLATLESGIASAEARHAELRDAWREHEGQREALQRQLQQDHRALADLNSRSGDRRARLEQLRARLAGVRGELDELEVEDRHCAEALAESRSALHRALESMEQLAGQREAFDARRDALRGALEQARQAAQADRDQAHQLALRAESLRSSRQSTLQNLERMATQDERLGERLVELRASLEAGVAPQTARQQELERLLAQRLEVEAQLGSARRELESIEAGIRGAEQARQRAEQTVDQRRGLHEETRLRCGELRVRGDTLREQITESGFDRAELLEALPDEAAPAAWQERLDGLVASIQRLGAINLAAIDEYRELSERMQYLDSQNADITESLETLQEAIRKIDRETRNRFRETFEKVSSQLGVLFPRLFGGGHAYLQLTGADLLDTGVTVMARPPGKRNSTIHLLSGGEKALTAVALVFSIFQLNPAPFCMLDEVDAPLDEANVGRFCDMVGEMAEKVQFVFITHNKVTMELARQLLGVTMNEPGVSRLVSVDVGEAVKMAVG